LLESAAVLTFIVHGSRSVGLSCGPPWPWALCAWPSRMPLNDAIPDNNLYGSRPSFLRLVFKDSVRILRFFGPHSTPSSPKTFCVDDFRQTSSHVVFQRSPLR
jgi:hypothetical protein